MLLRYLRGTRNLALSYRKTTVKGFVGHGDASYGVKRSHTGVVIMAGDSVITWRYCQQLQIARSTTDSEAIAMAMNLNLVDFVKSLRG